jgi:hypothetical protein
VWGGYPSLTPDSDSNQQPVLRHAGIVPAHSFRQVIIWVSVTTMSGGSTDLRYQGQSSGMSEMEACVDLNRGPRAGPLAIHQWWFLTSGVVACHGVSLLLDSSVAHI